MRRHLPMILALLALFALPCSGIAQESPVGRWRTIDDATGKTKSIVEIYPAKDGRYAGKVVEILDLKDGPDPVCDQCKGANLDKPIKGMVILWGLKPDGTRQMERRSRARSRERQDLQVETRPARWRPHARHVRVHRVPVPHAGVGARTLNRWCANRGISSRMR
jgi:hypothetical protein